jgi:hypothetical protein
LRFDLGADTVRVHPGRVLLEDLPDELDRVLRIRLLRAPVTRSAKEVTRD